MRWPMADGFSVDGTVGDMTTERLCDSPPEAEHPRPQRDGLLEFKTSISFATEGGTYEMLAPLTTVGSMLIHNDSLWWTDTRVVRLQHPS